LKRLYRAYTAAHALGILSRARYLDQTPPTETELPIESDSCLRATRIAIHGITNAFARYSEQFLGFKSTSLPQSSVAHGETVEDAFLVLHTTYCFKLDEFGKQLCDVIASIVPEKTPIYLVLDDGRVHESLHRGHTSFGRLSAAQPEPVIIKVTCSRM
jgi:hypothetical protein